MTPRFAVLRMFACPVAFLDGLRETAGETTEGGRDKRRGTGPRYVVVSTWVFACRCQWGSAASWLKRLICRNFHRAVVHPRGAAP